MLVIVIIVVVIVYTPVFVFYSEGFKGRFRDVWGTILTILGLDLGTTPGLDLDYSWTRFGLLLD